MFGIQFDAAGIYLVGTSTQQFHVPFEEMISFTGGILALLEYGLTWKVLKSVLGRMRHRLRDTSLETWPALWIDNSGPRFYEIRHGMDSILVDCADLEASCIGRAIKLHWDLGVQELGTCRTGRMVVEATLVGVWRNLRRLKVRRL